jgi:hypothetical protein
MRFLIIIFFSLVLVNCSQNNLNRLNDKTNITGGTDLIQTYALICNEYRNTDTEYFSCGSGFSTDLDLARAKAILQAKINVADILGSTLMKNEKEQVIETTKDGLYKKYDSSVSSQVFETTLNRYKIVWDKSFYENGKYRSFIIIKYTQS